MVKNPENTHTHTHTHTLLLLQAQSCLTLWDPMDCSPSGSSVQGIFQARIQEWVAISSSRESSQPRDGTYISCFSCTGMRILYHLAIWEAYISLSLSIYLSIYLSSIYLSIYLYIAVFLKLTQYCKTTTSI